MKTMFRVALMAALLAGVAASAEASVVENPDERTTEVHVVNNHLAPVRVYAEDAEGRLHRLGRVARGAVVTFEISEELRSGEFRIKVFPSPAAWSPVSDDYGVKTNPLSSQRDHRVTVWLETELDQSTVAIERG